MKKFFFGIALSLLMPTLFSFSGINSSSVTPRSTVKPIFFSIEKPKKGKKDKKDNTKQECGYWFKVLNNTTAPCSGVVLQLPPASTPPTTTINTTWLCEEANTYYCALSYPNRILVNGTWRPADANGIEITDYCDFLCARFRSFEL